MKINNSLTLIFILALFGSSVFSQKNDSKFNDEIKKANEKFDEYKFEDAQKMYKKLVDQGHRTKDLYAKLGDTYYFASDYKEAVFWYGKLMFLNLTVDPEYYARYSSALRSQNKHEEAWNTMQVYYVGTGKQKIEEDFDEENYFSQMKKQSGRYEDIKGTAVNSKENEFGTSFVVSEEAIKAAQKKLRDDKKKLAQEKAKQNEGVLDARAEAKAKAKERNEARIQANLVAREKARKDAEERKAKARGKTLQVEEATIEENDGIDDVVDNNKSVENENKKTVVKNVDKKAVVKVDKKSKNKKAKEDDSEEEENYSLYKSVIFAKGKNLDFTVLSTYSGKNSSNFALYEASYTSGGDIENPKKLKGDLGKKNQSSPAITRDGKTMYFSMLSDNKKALKNKNLKTVSNAVIREESMKIFKATFSNGKWGNIQELPQPVNMLGYSSAHPALSHDETELYFVSDRKNSLGNTDLYVVGRKKNGAVEKTVKSLGDKINTSGRETFPFVDEQGILYFASDGHPGYGGLDIFAAKKDENGEYIVVNVGEPVNSDQDDFGYVINSETKKGFFTSNRKGSLGGYDIYSFYETTPVVFDVIDKPILSGTVKDSISGQLLPLVEIFVYDENQKAVKSFFTDELGKYTTTLSNSKKHTLVLKKFGYVNKRLTVDPLLMGQKKEEDILMANELQMVVEGKLTTLEDGHNMADILKLEPIYFDYGSHYIRKDSEKQLDKIVKLLNERPSISIIVRSHTDSRGNDDFNMELSEKRSQSVVDYIVRNGNNIGHRIKGEGYGETRLLNGCSNGVQCTMAEHQNNRRSEFIVVIQK